MQEGTIKNGGVGHFDLEGDPRFLAGRITVPGVDHVELSHNERERALVHHRAVRESLVLAGVLAARA
jgi:hypothetical protein